MECAVIGGEELCSAALLAVSLHFQQGCSKHSPEQKASCSHKLSPETRSRTAPAEGALKTSSERWQEAEASLSLSWHLMEASRVLTRFMGIQSPF